MIYQNPQYCMGNRSRFEKFSVALGILANPWMLLADKLGLAKNPVYKSKTGMKFETRGGTTDVNDAVVVMSGREYPPELIGKPNVVLDCGGHIGTFSMYVKSQNPGAKIFVMEPVPDNLALLKKNIAFNNLTEITVIPFAIYGSSGKFYIDLANKQFDAVHVTPEKPAHNEFIEINAITLKKVLENYGIDAVDLMKLDIEGAEYNVFQNSLGDLASSVRRVIMEFHPAGDKEKRDEIVNRLCGNNDFKLIYETKNILGFDNVKLN